MENEYLGLFSCPNHRVASLVADMASMITEMEQRTSVFMRASQSMRFGEIG